MLSQGGKTILVKSNLTRTPIFIMHGIKILNSIAKEIDYKSRDFLWHDNMESSNTYGTIPFYLGTKSADSNVKVV